MKILGRKDQPILKMHYQPNQGGKLGVGLLRDVTIRQPDKDMGVVYVNRLLIDEDISLELLNGLI